MHRITLFSLSKNKVFDRLTEVNKGPKTSKPASSAYIGTVEAGLRSKSKPLRSKPFAILIVLRYILYREIFIKRKNQTAKYDFDGLDLL